jgi:hypothetical protein
MEIKQMTPQEFAAYVADQIASAASESPEQAQKRLLALKEEVGKVQKYVNDGQPSMPIAMYKDPFQAKRPADTASPPMVTQPATQFSKADESDEEESVEKADAEDDSWGDDVDWTLSIKR